MARDVEALKRKYRAAWERTAQQLGARMKRPISEAEYNWLKGEIRGRVVAELGLPMSEYEAYAARPKYPRPEVAYWRNLLGIEGGLIRAYLVPLRRAPRRTGTVATPLPGMDAAGDGAEAEGVSRYAPTTGDGNGDGALPAEVQAALVDLVVRQAELIKALAGCGPASARKG